MTKLFKIMALSGFIIIISAGMNPVEARKAMKATLEPADVHEYCMKVTPAQKVVYSFESEKPLDFNIHYHVGSEISYPVKEDGISTAEGTLEPEEKHTYCMMWTNPQSGPVDLSYKFRAKKK